MSAPKAQNPIAQAVGLGVPASEHLGDAYWRVGRKLEAKFQWQHAVDNKPEPDDLKRVQDKIKNGLPDEAPVTPAQNAAGKTNG